MDLLQKPILILIYMVITTRIKWDLKVWSAYTWVSLKIDRGKRVFTPCQLDLNVVHWSDTVVVQPEIFQPACQYKIHEINVATIEKKHIEYKLNSEASTSWQDNIGRR